MTNRSSTADALSEHRFVKTVFNDAMRVIAEIQIKGTVFKVQAEYSRPPTPAEFYCMSAGQALAPLLSFCKQMEHSVLYFSSFTPTPKMKSAGISRQSHLLHCIENYIIRTQGMYDRTLLLVDRIFGIYNPSHLITHELIISNLHVRHSSVPSLLQAIRKTIKDFYRDRNEIIHERGYL